MKTVKFYLFALLSLASIYLYAESSPAHAPEAKQANDKDKHAQVHTKETPAPLAPLKIAVIVNTKTPLTNLSTKQLELIFSGDTMNWRSLYGEDILLRPYVPSQGNELYELFTSKIMNSREFGPNTVILNGHDATLALIASKENAIAFVKYPFYKTEGVKVLAIDGIPPKADNYSLVGTASSTSAH